jgi:hypothetical protein
VGTRVAGIAIVKEDLAERKLCSLRVDPEFIGSGIGVKLFDECFEILSTTKPLLSVSEESLSSFDRVFKYFKFELAGRYQDLYRSRSTEFSFNGALLVPNESRIAGELLK